MIAIKRPMTGSGSRGRRGQSLVEYAMTVPVFLLILLGIMEFGFAFSHHLTLEYATREGARTGSAIANGTVATCAKVDDEIIASVQRVLDAAGSVDLSHVTEIHIYKASATGQEGAQINVWKPGSNGVTVAGELLKFHKDTNPGKQTWGVPCPGQQPRNNAANADSVGVSLTYDYQMVTPLASLMRIVGPATLRMTDRTVMSLNPTIQE